MRVAREGPRAIGGPDPMGGADFKDGADPKGGAGPIPGAECKGGADPMGGEECKGGGARADRGADTRKCVSSARGVCTCPCTR